VVTLDSESSTAASIKEMVPVRKAISVELIHNVREERSLIRLLVILLGSGRRSRNVSRTVLLSAALTRDEAIG
jgi:hypothetical protein